MHQPELLLFLWQGIRDPSVASLLPTWRWAARHILRTMDVSDRRVVVEYGPGTGVFTRELLRKLTPDSLLIAIERNPKFVKALRQIGDPRLTVVEGDALDVCRILQETGASTVDYALSGIPLSFLPPHIAQKLVSDTRACLKLKGAFIVYQYSPRASRYLRNTFPSVRRKWIWNIPPYVVFEARGKA